MPVNFNQQRKPSVPILAHSAKRSRIVLGALACAESILVVCDNPIAHPEKAALGTLIKRKRQAYLMVSTFPFSSGLKLSIKKYMTSNESPKKLTENRSHIEK